ncbi:MAG: ester cyclase [Caldilineaceae bacterium]
MKRLLTLMILLTLVAIGAPTTMLYAQDAAPAKDPETIFRAQYEAINAGDLEASLALVAENVVSIALPPPPDTNGVFAGHEAYRGLNSYLIGNHADFEFIDIQVNGNTLTFRALLTEDLFRAAGVFPIEFSGTAVVQDGLLVSETWIMNKQAAARLDKALTRENNKAILLRAYEEVFNKGNFAVLDEDIAPDAIDHDFPDLQGVDAFKLPLMGLREAFPDLQATADMIVAKGDLVMAVATFTGTHEGEFLGVPPSGKQITWRHVDVNRIVDGKVVEAWHIGAGSAMLEAMGYQLTPPAE